MGGVPTHYERILARLQREDAVRPDTTSLKFMFGAGAAVASQTVRALSNFGLVLKQGYGQTETSMLCCLEEGDAVGKAGSVGRPLEHLELRVIEPTSLTGPPSGWQDIVPSDKAEAAQVGEIVVRGPITMLGYWRNQAGTRETLRDGWVLTGDLARIDREGFITLVGRSREMFISGGENVYPAEVEAAFLRHPDISEIAVAAQPDERWGEVGVAFVVMKPGRTFNEDTLSDWASDLLARFKIPRDFRAVDELPKTASGKVQKFKLLRDA
jgi:fatty-acyl-CoA synthase